MSANTRADPAARTLYADPGSMTVRSVITTGDPDRAGDVVVPAGLRNVEDFLMNPVRFWAITYSSRGTAMTPLTIDGRLVYGLVIEVGRGLRIRLAELEYESLGLFEGQMIEVRVSGRPAASFHVLSASYVDPGWRWLMLTATPSRTRVAG